MVASHGIGTKEFSCKKKSRWTKKLTVASIFEGASITKTLYKHASGSISRLGSTDMDTYKDP